MISLKPFKGTRPFNVDAKNIIAPSTDHLSKENIKIIYDKNYWNYLKILNPVGKLKETETLIAAKNHFYEIFHPVLLVLLIFLIIDLEGLYFLADGAQGQ